MTLYWRWSPWYHDSPWHCGPLGSRENKNEGTRADDRPGEAGPVTPLLTILQRLPISQMTFKSLHHLALPISSASCSILPSALKVPSPWPISSIFVAFAYTVPLVCHLLFTPHPLLQLIIHKNAGKKAGHKTTWSQFRLTCFYAPSYTPTRSEKK